MFTVELRINGEKRFILTAVDSYTGIAYVYAYKNHSSASARDFLMRLYRPHASLGLLTPLEFLDLSCSNLYTITSSRRAVSYRDNGRV